MIRKKERVHAGGVSNVDYRSLPDIRLKPLFQPFKDTIDDETTSHSKLGLSNDKMKIYLKSYKNIFNKKEIIFESLNPKHYSSAIYYLENNIALKKRTLNQSNKITEIEQSFKGNDEYTGDSMMISDNTKKKKSKKVLPDTKINGNIINLYSADQILA